MRKITTSKGKTYPVDYCGIGYLAMLKMQLRENRTLGEVAPEMDGLEWVEYVDEDFPEETFHFDGYSKLKRIDWIDDRSVVILLDQEAEDGNSEV